jgi:hypothetical protein
MSDVSVTVNDPASADVQAVCGTLKAAFEFGCTPQGQALIAQALADSAAFRKLLADGWSNLQKLFPKG